MVDESGRYVADVLPAGEVLIEPWVVGKTQAPLMVENISPDDLPNCWRVVVRPGERNVFDLDIELPEDKY